MAWRGRELNSLRSKRAAMERTDEAKSSLKVTIRKVTEIKLTKTGNAIREFMTARGVSFDS